MTTTMLEVGNKCCTCRKIGSGTFSDVYQATNIISGDKVAVKLKSVETEYPQLKYKACVYESLTEGVGIPSVHWFGTEGNYNVLTIDRLDPSLEDLFQFCNRKFSLNTVLLLADQLLSRIKYIHDKSFIHCDIKPDNFLMRIDKCGNQMNVIDFDSVKKYCNSETGVHIFYCENKTLTETTCYASINNHLSVKESRHDNMESLDYILLYFYHESLSWQGLKAATKKEIYDRIREKKMITSTEVLCDELFKEFAIYLDYTRLLRFNDKPNYSYLCKIFRDLHEPSQYGNVFDWVIKYQNTKNAQCSRQIEPPAESGQSKPQSGCQYDDIYTTARL